MSEKPTADQSPSTNRIEAFSDGVFAIVITLLVLELHAPQIEHPENWQELFGALFSLAPKYLGFVMSFFFVAVFWVSHHQFFQTLNLSRRGLLWLNNLFLFFITFIGFPTGVLGQYPNNLTAVIFFGATFLATSLTFAVLRWYGWVKTDLITDKVLEDSLRHAMRRSFLLPLLYIIGICAAFFSLQIAIAIYFLTPILLIVPLRLRTKASDAEDLEV